MSPIFKLTPDPEGAHVLRPVDVSSPAFNPQFIEALVLLDLGALKPELAGHQALCVAHNASDETLVLEHTAEGKWKLVQVDGMEPADVTKGTAWAEGFEDGAHTFEGLEPVAKVTLKAIERVDTHAHKVCLTLGEPEWVQSPDPPSGEGWVFVARIDTYYTAATYFVFYHPESRRVHHVHQQT